MTTLLALLIDLSDWRPEALFGNQVLERTPAGLSIFYLIGIGILTVFLVMTLIENLRRHKFIFEQDLPARVAKKLTQSVANRGLLLWHALFIVLALSVFGSQVYWTYFADESNAKFQELAYKDLRARRSTSATLRGWMFDRSGKLGSSLAYYKVGKDGQIGRAYALEKEMAHILGTERGTPGLDRTLYKRQADPMPEAWEVLTQIKRTKIGQDDIRITIDRDLQAYLAQALGKRNGAIVVINPQTGDLLGMYSNPAYSLSDVETLEGYLKLEADQANKPLLNRAIREFYIPGSTFKTFTMLAAFRSGKQNATFPGKPAPECYTPFRGSRPICDAGGSCNLCQPNISLLDAFKVSSNQYFAQMANELGNTRMAEMANLLGIAPVETSREALTRGFYPDIWNTSDLRIANALAPSRSTIVTGKQLSLYDSGVIGMGQGGAGQMTPFQMALIAAAAGNLQGKLMKPKIEADLAPQAYSQVLSPEQARVVREIMGTVTQEPGGTGGIVRAKLGGTGITTGGKTGTADKDGVQLYNKDGTKQTVKKRRRGDNGEWMEYDEPVKGTRWDGWFLAIAPLENPQLAIAVVVEDIGGAGYGGTTAAPIAADVILKARDLGLLGEQFKPKAPVQRPQRRQR